MEETIKNIIAKRFNTHLTDETNLTELAQDSFGKVELLFELEKELNIKIPEDDILNIETIEDLTQTVKKLYERGRTHQQTPTV